MLPQPAIIFPEWDGAIRCYEDLEIFFHQFLPCDYWLTNSARDVQAGDPEIFPNPASRQLLVRTNFPSEYSIKNFLGEILLCGKTFKQSTSIDVSFLPEGIYFLNLENGREKWARKFEVSKR